MPYDPVVTDHTEIQIFPPSTHAHDKQVRQTPQLAELPLKWFHRTWTVTHSTLPMWRKSRNVRITYKPIPGKAAWLPSRIDDLVEHEKLSNGKYQCIHGVDTPDPHNEASFNWRGTGLLGIASSHWEILGYGQSPIPSPDGQQDLGQERWVVTYFAATMFTPEGLDIYCDRPEGLRSATFVSIMRAIDRMEDTNPSLKTLVQKDLKEVQIKLPWAPAKSRSWWN